MAFAHSFDCASSWHFSRGQSGLDSSAADWAEKIAGCARSFADGDFAALGELFDLTASRLLRYAESVLRSREDAEDAVQAALVRIARNPRSLSAVRMPWAYLLKVTRNEALRILARKKPWGTWLHLLAECAVPCERPVRSERIESAERDAEVQAALQRLPSEQAEVVILKIWEGLTFQEIATVTGESLNTVASRYRYALSKLELVLRRTAREAGWVLSDNQSLES